MILRNKRINKGAQEIQVNVAYGEPDIKRWFPMIFNIYFLHGSEWHTKERLQEPVHETYIWEILQSDPRFFGNYPLKWSEGMARWAFTKATELKLITPSESAVGLFYFSDSCVPKKKGRPRKEP